MTDYVPQAGDIVDIEYENGKFTALVVSNPTIDGSLGVIINLENGGYADLSLDEENHKDMEKRGHVKHTWGNPLSKGYDTKLRKSMLLAKKSIKGKWHKYK